MTFSPGDRFELLVELAELAELAELPEPAKARTKKQYIRTVLSLLVQFVYFESLKRELDLLFRAGLIVLFPFGLFICN